MDIFAFARPLFWNLKLLEEVSQSVGCKRAIIYTRTSQLPARRAVLQRASSSKGHASTAWNHGRHLMTEIMAHSRPEEAQRIVGKKCPSSSALAFMGGVVVPPSAPTMVFAKAKDVPMPTDPGSRTWRAASYLTCCWPLEAMTCTICPCHGHSDLTIMFRRPVHASPLLPGPASNLVK